jgi:hypothetical protein
MTEERKKDRARWNKAYITRKNAAGIEYRSFLLPSVLIDQVREYIKQQSALLLLNNPPQEKV